MITFAMGINNSDKYILVVYMVNNTKWYGNNEKENRLIKDRKYVSITAIDMIERVHMSVLNWKWKESGRKRERERDLNKADIPQIKNK